MISFTPTSRYAVAGIKRVLVAAFAPGTRCFFAPPSAPLPADLVTELQPAPVWYRLTATDTASATLTATPTKNGVRYEQKITLPFVTGLSRLQRHALTALFAQPVWALVEDAQGNWWLAGKSRGVRCVSLTWATGFARASEIIATATLEGAEPEAWHPFSPTAARALYAAADAETDNPPVEEGPGGGGDS